MVTVNRDAQILFFNSLLRGTDVRSIIRISPLAAWEIFIGIGETFILTWLAGASVANYL